MKFTIYWNFNLGDIFWSIDGSTSMACMIFGTGLSKDPMSWPWPLTVTSEGNHNCFWICTLVCFVMDICPSTVTQHSKVLPGDFDLKITGEHPLPSRHAQNNNNILPAGHPHHQTRIQSLIVLITVQLNLYIFDNKLSTNITLIYMYFSRTRITESINMPSFC